LYTLNKQTDGTIEIQISAFIGKEDVILSLENYQ
jgi:hypothetical protein